MTKSCKSALRNTCWSLIHYLEFENLLWALIISPVKTVFWSLRRAVLHIADRVSPCCKNISQKKNGKHWTELQFYSYVSSVVLAKENSDIVLEQKQALSTELPLRAVSESETVQPAAVGLWSPVRQT